MSMNSRTVTSTGGTYPETSRAPARPGTLMYSTTIGFAERSMTSALHTSEKSLPA